MWQAIVFGFLGGVMGANGYPHFTRGITKKRYPGTFGNGPVPNLVAGWVLLVISAVLFYFAHVGRHPGWSFGAAAIGVLLMGALSRWSRDIRQARATGRAQQARSPGPARQPPPLTGRPSS